MTIRAAIVEDGKVKNIVKCSIMEQGWIDVTSMSVGVGDLYDGINFTKPAPPALTPEEVQQQMDSVARAEVKADAVITYLTNHTPAECVQYVQDNVTDLASAKAFLKKVAMALSILSKQIL